MIAAVGRWKHSPERELFEQYVARSPWKIELRELAPIQTSTPSLQQTRETAALLAAAADARADRRVFLDETGRDLDSPAFAKRLGEWRDQGCRQAAFLIGGDLGLDKSQLKEADLVLSLGRLTWPHLLVRTLLSEQLYRAQTILSGHPYHRV